MIKFSKISLAVFLFLGFARSAFACGTGLVLSTNFLFTGFFGLMFGIVYAFCFYFISLIAQKHKYKKLILILFTVFFIMFAFVVYETLTAPLCGTSSSF